MDRPIRVLELRSVRGTGGGPEKTIMLGAARTDPQRFKVTVCYIRDRRDTVFTLHERARQLGLDYVEVTEAHSFDPSVWPALRRLVRDRRIDVVHAHDYKTNALALLLGRRERVRPLSTVHGWTGQSWREMRLYYPLDRKLLARFPRLIAVSGELRDELVRAGSRADRVTVVLNGIDPARFRRDRAREPQVRQALGFKADDVVIGAVGRTEQQKRFDILLDVFASLHRDRPALRLVIVGDGSLRPALEAQAARLGVASACLFAGQRPDVADLHHGFDLLAQSSEYEGTPNVVLEARALETPIVATDVGGTRDLAHDGVHALIVPPHDQAALARAISAALDDREATARRVRAARERVEGPLSFECRMRTVEGIYEELAAAGTA